MYTFNIAAFFGSPSSSVLGIRAHTTYAAVFRLTHTHTHSLNDGAAVPFIAIRSSKVNRQENLCMRRANTKQCRPSQRSAACSVRETVHIMYIKNMASYEQFFVSGMCVRTHTRNTYGRFGMKTQAHTHIHARTQALAWSALCVPEQCCVFETFFNVTMRSLVSPPLTLSSMRVLFRFVRLTRRSNTCSNANSIIHNNIPHI